MNGAKNSGENDNTNSRSLPLLLIAVMFVGLYPILRYRGLWGETDTAVFTAAVRAIIDADRLIPLHNVYPNGYGYQTVVVWLLELSGASLASLQLYAAMLLVVWLVLPAWLLYRAFIGSAQGALLATVLLLVQPEFLFPALRGTHEKFTRGLMLFALFMLVRSLDAHSAPRRLPSWILIFYVTVYALITFNNLLAASFIAATGLSLLLVLLSLRLPHTRRVFPKLLLRRLLYAVLVAAILVVLFTFYIYPPAAHNVRILESIWDRLAILFLNVEAIAANPYESIATAWISLPVYLLMSMANWLLLLLSAGIWLLYSQRWLRGRWRPETGSIVLLWAFYGAFAFISALSILVDVSGAIAANLQHRMFPSFVMLAAPLVAWWWIDRQFGKGKLRRTLRPLLAVVVAGFAVLALLKASNEPLLSNNWLFSLPAETRALTWADDKLGGRSLWTAYDERLKAASTIRRGGLPLRVRLDKQVVEPRTRDFLISTITRARSERLDVALPVQADSLITYDNGEAQIYHLRPRTPFQR